MGDADFWELLTKHGINPDSATAIVKSRGGMNNADLWERLTQNGAAPDAATMLVNSSGGQKPAPDIASDVPGVTMRDLGRSFVQGATFGFGDNLGLTDRDKEATFKKNHGFADFGMKLLGGAIAPAAAVAAAPEALGGAAGAALLGGAASGLTAAGEDDGDTIGGRLKAGAEGAAIGAPVSLLGYGAAKGIGAAGSKILDKINPARAVARSARNLLGGAADDVASNMDDLHAMAPGSASIGTSVVAPELNQSRFLSMFKGVGSDPAAAAGTEAQLTAQKIAQNNHMTALGARMTALDHDVEVTPQLQQTLNNVKGVLGSKTPFVPSADDGDPAGAMPVSIDPDAAPTMRMQDLRDALTRLRFLSRKQAKLALEANGVDTHAINQARQSLQAEIYAREPEFEGLDTQYSQMKTQQRQTNALLKVVQRSRNNHEGNSAFGSRSGSLGGSLPQGYSGMLTSLMDHALTNKAGAARAVQRLVANPGGADMLANLLRAAPKPIPAAVTTGGMGALGSLPGALKGLLFSNDDEQ